MSGISVSAPPIVLQGAAALPAAATLVMMLGAPSRVTAATPMPLTRPGFYVITDPGLTITLLPSAACVCIKDMVGSSTIAASVDENAGGARFTDPKQALTLSYSPDLATWLIF